MVSIKVASSALTTVTALSHRNGEYRISVEDSFRDFTIYSADAVDGVTML